MEEYRIIKLAVSSVLRQRNEPNWETGERPKDAKRHERVVKAALNKFLKVLSEEES